MIKVLDKALRENMQDEVERGNSVLATIVGATGEQVVVSTKKSQPG